MTEFETVQCILFNYPINAERLDSLLDHYNGSAASGSIDKNSIRLKGNKIGDSLLSTLRTHVQGKVTLLFSSGYDSRCLFAALTKLDKEFEAAVWSIPNPYNEIELVRKICFDFGVELKVLPSDSITVQDLEASVIKFSRRISGRLSASRSFLIPLLEQVSQYSDMVVWGEGELIRPPVLPSEYINRNVLRLLSGETNIEPPEFHSIFSDDLPYSFVFEETRKSIEQLLHIPFHERLALWIAFVAYPAIYEPYTLAASAPATGLLPFIEKEVVDASLSSPISLVSEKTWRRNPFVLNSTRKLYSIIINRLNGKLLRYHTDRGYSPILDKAGLGGLATAVRKIIPKRKPDRKNGIIEMQDKALANLIEKVDLLGLEKGKEEILQSMIEQPLAGNDRYELAKLLSIAIGNAEDTV